MIGEGGKNGNGKGEEKKSGRRRGKIPKEGDIMASKTFSTSVEAAEILKIPSSLNAKVCEKREEGGEGGKEGR